MTDWRNEHYCYITTTGRRTGKPHTVEIWFASHDQTLYILAGDGERSDTVQNLRADPAVHIRIGAQEWDATARFLDDPFEEQRARTLVPARYKDEEDGLDAWARSALPFAIDLP